MTDCACRLLPYGKAPSFNLRCRQLSAKSPSVLSITLYCLTEKKAGGKDKDYNHLIEGVCSCFQITEYSEGESFPSRSSERPWTVIGQWLQCCYILQKTLSDLFHGNNLVDNMPTNSTRIKRLCAPFTQLDSDVMYKEEMERFCKNVHLLVISYITVC